MGQRGVQDSRFRKELRALIIGSDNNQDDMPTPGRGHGIRQIIADY
jgi:hypothetical protein